MAIYVSIVMYGLRLFIVVLQELHCLSNCLHVLIHAEQARAGSSK